MNNKRTIIVLVLLFIFAPFILSAQTMNDWSQNPTTPSLLLMAGGEWGQGRPVYAGEEMPGETTLGTTVSALLEIPASNKTNILLRLNGVYRDEDIGLLDQRFRSRLRGWNVGLGFGIRFLLK